MEHILQTQFGGRTIQEIQRDIEEFAKDFDGQGKVMEIVADKSFVHFDSRLISRINNAVVKPAYRGSISYESLNETLPNGDSEATGINIRIDCDAYLSEIFENSPYGIIKKNRTGGGATTLELKSQRNSIIVVPTKTLAYDKAIDDAAGVYKYLYVGSSIDDSIPFPRMDEYISNERIEYKKIIVVADSLKKVIDAIGESVYKTYFLMVDEVDIYQLDSTFRPALEDVVDHYFMFASTNRCLVSATIRDFCNPKLNTEDVINIDYTHTKQRKISLIHTNNIHAKVKERIEDIFRNHTGEKIFIAYNKILYIRQIIENLSPECKAECVILCSEASKQQAQPYFKKKLDENRLPARIAFATNPFFAGIDIKERFHLISVSNIDPLYTLLSPDRYLQIAGRCRPGKGVYSETIIYNTKVYDGKVKPDAYGRYLLELAYDITEYMNQADTLFKKYKSYGFLDESFVKEVKDDILKRSDRYYYHGTKMPLVRQDKFTKEYLPAFFNIDSLHELLKHRINTYINPDNLYNELRKNNIILCYDTKNSEYTESQLRNEAIAEGKYARIEEGNLAGLIDEIRHIASVRGFSGFFHTQLNNLHRRATRGQRKFLEPFMSLYEYVPLENKENVIVCCPTIQLIKNKVSQYNKPNPRGKRCPYELLGVFQGKSTKDIEVYVEWCKGRQPVKIMTTYDSFPRVAEAIGNNLMDYKIVVDEYQEILDAAVYRKEAIKSLLRELRGFENVTYVSATPIPYKYFPEELTGLPRYEIHWPEQSRIKPFREQTDSPFSYVVEIINKHKAGIPLVIGGHTVEEYFFFVNSVKTIRKILRAAGLRPDEVKIICANCDINKLKLGDEFKIQDISDPNKTFTFCTKTVFYGADFYSDAGLIVVVSDGYVKSTLLDISSDILQIAGRIRNENNPFKNMILHIHSPSTILPSQEEFEAELAERINKAEKDINAFDKLARDGLESVIIEKQKNNEPEAVSYYDPDTHSVKIDTLKIAHMKHKFDTIYSIYTDGISMRKAYERAGYNVEEAETWIQSIKQWVSMSGSMEPFHEYYLIYSQERKKMTIGRTDLARNIEQQYPLISQAYNLLGDFMAEKLKYDEEKIRQWVHFKSPTTQSALKLELINNYLVGENYTNKKAKEILGRIFANLGIELTPTAAFLRNLLRVKKVKLPNPERPKRDDGIRIMRGICMMILTVHEKQVA